MLTPIDMTSPTWPVHRKHIFILSKSGKPVYARYGCEEKLVGLFGIMQALISIIEEDGNDELRCTISLIASPLNCTGVIACNISIHAKKGLIAILFQQPIHIVC